MPKEAEKKSKSVRHPEAKGLLFLGCSFLLLLCLMSFHRGHPSDNWLGLLGYYSAWVMTYVFGFLSYPLVVFTGWVGWKLLSAQKVPQLGLKTLYFSILLISSGILLNLVAETDAGFLSGFKSRVYSESIFIDLPYPQKLTRYNLGGVPLYYLYRDLSTFNLHRMLSPVGCFLTFSITGVVAFLFLTGMRIQPLLELIGKSLLKLAKELKAISLRPEKKEDVLDLPSPTKTLDEIEASLSQTRSYPTPPPPYEPNKKIEPKIRTSTDFAKIEEKEKKAAKEDPLEFLSKKEIAIATQKVYNGDYTHYQLPPPSLLRNPKKVDQPSLKKDLRRQAEILEETLLSFGIEAKVGEINCGPTITSFEVHPAVGVKVQKITALENDIALKLQAKSIRIIAPIPGKAAVGVEIPSLYPQEVSFKELLLDYQQSQRKQHIPVLLGKTVNGDNVISDLSKMPHCIIAGATGSGKSVCINTLILSILMNARPDEIKLLMVDPKKVELTAYTNLPHMIAPVITEAHGAYAALSWLVKEMQTRYEILKQLGLRNVGSFNSRPANTEAEAAMSIPIPARMPSIVAIIDEFADLMMASSSDLETPIARIAQMARAVGIHLVLATQRPSREVITGLIKANFPTRIAFKVASRVNSQIILDDVGAESLLGNGDMLFLPPGSSHLIRSQGVYVTDEEINRIISFICDQAPANYLIPSFDSMRREDLPSEGTSEETSSSKDNLYQQALSIVLDTRTASTTFLQRKLKIGYARAASLMDELETNGVIGPQEGSKPRRILADGATQDEFSLEE
jgi:S-DNA-T family DNA segregation ATPase FtsK/SpoIIIE